MRLDSAHNLAADLADKHFAAERNTVRSAEHYNTDLSFADYNTADCLADSRSADKDCRFADKDCRFVLHLDSHRNLHILHEFGCQKGNHPPLSCLPAKHGFGNSHKVHLLLPNKVQHKCIQAHR